MIYDDNYFFMANTDIYSTKYMKCHVFFKLVLVYSAALWLLCLIIY